MSCPDLIGFKNEAKDIEIRIFVNLGWFSPTEFQLARIIIDAAKELPDNYEWDRLHFVKNDFGYMTKESFDNMCQAVNIINKQGKSALSMSRGFTLKRTWLKE